jgi:Fe-S oxidoreductase
MLDFRFFFTLTLAVVCGAIAFRSFGRLWAAMMNSKAERQFDQIPRRIGIVMMNILGHKKMMKDFWPGLFHAFIFFGFIAVTIGTTEHIIEGLVHGFSLSFLGPIYGTLTLIQDFLQFLVVVAVVYFFIRRLVVKPSRMPKEWKLRKDGLIVLCLTGFHMFADIMSYTFWIQGGDPHGQGPFRPFSTMLAHALGATGIAPADASAVGWTFWCIHIATVFGFLMYIPHSKHLHIITAGPNAFFARLRHRGTFSLINFEDETQTTFGVAKVSDFSWKDILDTYSCTACGRCNEFCPTATTGKPLRPMELIQDIKREAWLHQDTKAAAKDGTVIEAQAIVDQRTGISEDVVWACTTCKACVEACPVMIEHVDKIVDMRRNLVLMEGRMPQELQNTFKNWETQSNPWGMSSDGRDAWAKELNVARLADKPNAEYLFYVGCAGSFNARNQKISTAFVQILQKAGVDFAILGKEELCNGETARRSGNEYLAKTMIDANIEVLKRHNVKKVLTTCPHCFNTLKNEYPDFGFKAESVRHHTEFLDVLVKEGKVKLETTKETVKVAFHDSCYLGRYNEVYEQPRSLLRAAGVEVVEMPRNRSKGLCCGAGGARMWMEETVGKRINEERVAEALQSKPDIIAAGCPYCQVMISDGVNAHKAERVQVKDVAEIVAERMI